MTDIETTTLSKTVFRTTVWKCYIHDIFSLCDMSKPDIKAFIEEANLHHPTIEFTAETFDTETAFYHWLENLALIRSNVKPVIKHCCSCFKHY